jgi:hypothetical protein
VIAGKTPKLVLIPERPRAHNRRRFGNQRGQSLASVLALFAGCGMLTFLIDAGWRYQLRISARSRAESAALAAVQDARARRQVCAARDSSTRPVACSDVPRGSVLQAACAFAPDMKRVTAGGAESFPGKLRGPGIVRFWATATVEEAVPAIAPGTPNVSESATAALIEVPGLAGQSRQLVMLVRQSGNSAADGKQGVS